MEGLSKEVVRTCLIAAGDRSATRRGVSAGPIAESSRLSTPTTTGHATDVPHWCWHPPPGRAAQNSPCVTTSTAARPVPWGSSQRVMPRDDHGASARPN